MSLDAVLKIGGSLSRGDGLEILCREISRLSGLYPLLVVPGGAEFADHVREAYRRFTLGETTAHNMALLAMDQFGYMLHDLIPGSLLSSSTSLDIGSATVLIYSGPVPHYCLEHRRKPLEVLTVDS